MKLKIKQNPNEIKSFLVEIQAQLRQELARLIASELEAEVEAWLYRGYHVRKATVKGRSQAQCQRCGSQEASDFMRNGHRKRQMVTQLGVIEFWLPRVLCRCGGSVQIPFSIVKPYQQIWEDVGIQIQRWAELGLSLRQMQEEIGAQCGTQIGLRYLNESVQSVNTRPAIELSSVPPVVMLDAIWVTLLADTSETFTDSLQRKRRHKVRRKVCILVALGLYPQSGRWGILSWQLAEQESQTAWEQLLVPLETRGLYRQRGLELLIHDGGKGLIAALNLLYPNVPHQRCAFHKLRNLWSKIQAPADLSRDDARQFKRDILAQVQAIFYAENEHEAGQIRDDLCAQYHDTQPAFVATLQRDWHETIAFFKVLQLFSHWRRTILRTTSLLERVNRMLRRLFRAASAFHSVTGLLAAVARILEPKRLI